MTEHLRRFGPFAAALLAALTVLGWGASASGAATIAYPDLQLLMPTNSMAIATSGSSRQLEFTHITWNAGTGPWELRPDYNDATGIAMGFQALYTEPSPGKWSFDETVPVVGPMIWNPPSDYDFPLDSFKLYTVAANGGVGSLVATSPKIDFCMTPDTFVGGVANAPSSPSYPQFDCEDSTGTLGLDVGWGDEYDQTDGGEDIDISSLPNGDYWLQGIVDPYHYFQESNDANNVVDTELDIQGGTLTVLQQTQPDDPPPVVSLTSPVSGSPVSGTVGLDASATDPSGASITQVQFLLDGEPIGAPVTTPPYTFNWTIGNVPTGQHYLSAQALDSNGFYGTAPAVPITVTSGGGGGGTTTTTSTTTSSATTSTTTSTSTTTGGGGTPGPIAVDANVNETGNGAVTTGTFSTPGSNDVLLAFVGSDGPNTGQTVSVSGAGLTWRLVDRENAEGGDSEIWTATASGPLTNATVTSTPSIAGYDQSVTVLALSGASGIGTSSFKGATTGAPSLSMTATAAGSAMFMTGNDYNNDIARTVGSGQTLVNQFLDTKTGDTYWTQETNAPTTGAGESVTLNDTAPTGDPSNLVGVEVLAAPEATTSTSTSSTTSSSTADTTSSTSTHSTTTSSTTSSTTSATSTTSTTSTTPTTTSTTTTSFTTTESPPSVNILAPLTGQTVSGTTIVSANAVDSVGVTQVQFYLDGQPLGAPVDDQPYAIQWDTTTATNGTHTLTAVATNESNETTTSAPVTVTVQNPAPNPPCFVQDAHVSVHGKNSVTTPTFTTAAPGDTLLAFVSADGPGKANGQTATVSGAGLTWKLVDRENTSFGDAEIWSATASTQLSNVAVTSKLGKTGYNELLSVVAYEDTDGIGATAVAAAPTGAPSLSLVTSGPGSLVFAVGHDWDNAVARTVGPNQSILDQYLDTSTGDTYWSQYTSAVLGNAMSSVTINDTSPTTDQWDLAAVELLSDDG